MDFRTFVDHKLRTASQEIVSLPWADRKFYALWLRQSFEYVRQSTRILSLTGGMLPPSLDSTSRRFMEHAREEKGHEKLLIGDARQLGVDLDSIRLLPEAEAFHKSLYYWIFQSQPIVILGWVLALEGLAVHAGKTVCLLALAAHGKGTCTFLEVHSIEDESHLEDALATVASLPDTEREAVLHGFELYLSLYQKMCQAARAEAELNG